MSRNTTVTAAGTLALGAASTSAVLTLAQDAPTLDSEGVYCAGFSHILAQAHTLVGVTEYKLQVWGYVTDSAAWTQVVDSVGLAKEYTMTNQTFGETFRCAGFDRFFVRLSSITGTSLKISHRPFGPGV